MDARQWRPAMAGAFLWLYGFAPAVPAREACPFLRDPAYWARTPAPPAARGELAIGTLNVFRLFDDEQDGDERTRPASGEFRARIARIARYIARDMGAPVAIGLQEVEDETALDALATALARERGYSWAYVAGERPAGSDIRSALLYDSRLRVAVHATPFAAQATTPESRFDRPPLVVDIDPRDVVPRLSPFALVIVHLKSQRGIDRPADEARVLGKRRAQALRLAAWLRAQGGRRLVVLGDFNAPVHDAGGVRSEPLRILLAGGNLVDVAARFLAPAQRWTYRYRCSLQELDHLLVTPVLAPSVAGYAIARGDTCLRAAEPCRPATSVSDHEGVVLRLRPGNAGQ